MEEPDFPPDFPHVLSLADESDKRPGESSADAARQRLDAMIRAIAEQTRRAIQLANLDVELCIQSRPALASRRVRTARRHGVAAWVHPTPRNTRH
jgi:hypothetical protein